MPDTLHLQWQRELEEPMPAWPPEQYKLQFDYSYEPIAMGGQVFIASMVTNSLTAYDIETGDENWIFYCDGPIRLAPVASKGKVYFASDDGYLYCLEAVSGKQLWTFTPGMSKRKILGNDRMISAWPIRGAPVISDNKIYCAAGIWPFMGIFIYCLDVETGDIIWENSSAGSVFINQQHNSPAFAGVAPQGYLAVNEDKLLVTGRTVPACFDAKTGELLYYRLSDREYGKHVGGYGATIWKQWFINNGVVYKLEDGKGIAKSTAFITSDQGIVAIDSAGDILAYQPAMTENNNEKKNEKPRAKGIWKFTPKVKIDKIHFQAGNRLYASGPEGIIAILDIPDPAKPGRKQVCWQTKLSENIWSMITANGKLLVVTEKGSLYCFGEVKRKIRQHRLVSEMAAKPSKKYAHKVANLLESNGTDGGYGLLLGADNDELLMEILRQSAFKIIVLESNENKVNSLRHKLNANRLYGRRVTVFHSDILTAELPPYFANFIVCEEPSRAGLYKQGFMEKVYYSLRPYGGIAYFGTDFNDQQAMLHRVNTHDFFNCTYSITNNSFRVCRNGALAGSADWTHQYGDIANTVCSQDNLHGPLGILWFGDSAKFAEVLPRHAHGPPEQVVSGRLFIQGIDSISARDVYTGRTLWKKELKNLNTFGIYYDKTFVNDYNDLSYNQAHIPGANARGTNFVATSDSVYVISDNKCQIIDADNGNTKTIINLPSTSESQQRTWAYIGVYEDMLIAGADYAQYLSKFDGINKPSKEDKKTDPLGSWKGFLDKTASSELVIMDRHSGQVRWRLKAKNGFIHNAIIAGNGRLYCLDSVPALINKLISDNDITLKSPPRMLCVDIQSGEILWEKTEGIFGSWLSYSQKYNLLLQADRKSRDMLWESGSRMAVYKADVGDNLWDKNIKYEGPCILHGDTIITQKKAYELLTGKPVMRKHPLTGKEIPWQYSRNYGCNTVIASKNLLTFRSAAAGYLDLTLNDGTGNFGGFKSGCTSNLVIANGVLNAPDYTQTCTCSYQNQSSLAMIQLPDVEHWTFSDLPAPTSKIMRAGINLGAPGDRKAENGTLWLDYPSVGGQSPIMLITTDPAQPKWFCHHSSRLKKGHLKWVEASGAKGLHSITVDLNPDKTQNEKLEYTVRLYFAEPDDIKPGERVFTVKIFTDDANSNSPSATLKDIDICKQAGNSKIGITREFSGIHIVNKLHIVLEPAANSKIPETILCGIEVVLK
ncbi:MAG: PQQ-binding-like beta-propeller repeat protein [Phycisphaerae bacterium]|nr:PQQ-binding-like beta-propeller repeat protein [Phycisphaerae bacterium]